MVNIYHRLTDFFITVFLWFYFLFGYLVFFLALFLPAYIFSENSATAFQRINHVFLKSFFGLTRFLVPRTKFKIDREVPAIRSSVIVCNHISYLDPILLISLSPLQRTIVKKTFFQVPIFGWFLRQYGFIPSSPAEMLGETMIKNLESIKQHLAEGGNLFIFPEGTRSRDGRLAPFNRGVFSIARYCSAPLRLVFIKGTDKLFQPGSFLFNTHSDNEIEIELIGAVEPDFINGNLSVAALSDYARRMYLARMAGRDKDDLLETTDEASG